MDISIAHQSQMFDVMLDSFKGNGPIMLQILGLAWCIHFLNLMLGYKLNIFGIVPRHPWGLIGIVASPVLHGNFSHLFFNSGMFFIFGCLVCAYTGLFNFFLVSAFIMLFGGGLVWLFGRKAMHVGASGLILGYFGFLMSAAFYAPSIATILVAILGIIYWGSLFLSLVPQGPDISWEGHLFGFGSGVVACYAFLHGYIDFAYRWLMYHI